MWRNAFIGNNVPEDGERDPMEGKSVLSLSDGKKKRRSLEHSSNIRITIAWQLEPNFSEKESDPMIYLDTNLHYGRKKAQMIGVPIETNSLDKSQETGGSISHVYYTTISYPKGRKLPADASLWFHSQAKQKSSENISVYENTGSSRVLLSDILSVSDAKDRDFTYQHKKGMIVHLHPVKMACLKYSKPNAGPKGYIHAWLHDVNGGKNVQMSKVKPYDWVPHNNAKLEKHMYVSIEKNMGIFTSPIKHMYKSQFDPISPELKHVHAPLYSTPVTTLPGWVYFARLTQESDPSEKMYSRIARVVLARTKISEDDFINMCKLPHPSSKTKDYPMRLHQASSMVVMIAATLPNSLPYIGDYAYVSYEPNKVQKVLIPRKGKGKKGFVYGVGKFFHMFKVHSSERITDESFDDPLLRKAGDCEDLASLVLRVLGNIQYGEWSDPVLIAAQGISRHYAYCASLGSVTARNLKEGRTHNTGQVEINSRADKESGYGAHMWVTGIPLARLGEMVDKNNGNGYSKGKITLPHGYTINSVPGGWDKRLPVTIGEGTGKLYPLVVPPEAYFGDIESKRYTADQGIKSQEAYARLETSMSVNEIKAIGGTAKKLPIFAHLETMKRQKSQKNNRNVRPSAFYRDYSSLFFIDSIRSNPTWKGWKSSDVSLPQDVVKDPESILSAPSWKLVRPVQVGTREEDMGTPDDVGPDLIRHGIPMADMLNKREHVGVVMEGMEAPETLRVMASAARHLPAPKKMEDFTPEESRRLDETVRRANSAFEKLVNSPRSSLRKDWEETKLQKYHSLKKLGIMGILDSPSLNLEESEQLKDSDMHLTQCYKKILDNDANKVSLEFAKELAKNKYVLGAKVSGEELVNGVGNLRFDIIVDTSGRICFDPSNRFEHNLPV